MLSKLTYLLVARSADKLKDVAKNLSDTYKIKAAIFSVDLSRPASAQKVIDWVNQNSYSVNILINNAGYGLWGEIEKSDLEKLHNMMQLQYAYPGRSDLFAYSNS